MVLVLSISLWLPRYLKQNVQNETTKRFLVGNTKINILLSIKANFVHEVLRNYTKLDEVCSWNQRSNLKF